MTNIQEPLASNARYSYKNIYTDRQGICSSHRICQFITTCPEITSFDLILIQLNHIFTSYFPMNNGVALMVYTRIWDVPSLNLGWDTHYPHWGLSKLVSVHPSTYKTVPQLGHDHLLPSIFQFIIHQSPKYQCHTVQDTESTTNSATWSFPMMSSNQNLIQQALIFHRSVHHGFIYWTEKLSWQPSCTTVCLSCSFIFVFAYAHRVFQKRPHMFTCFTQ